MFANSKAIAALIRSRVRSAALIGCALVCLFVVSCTAKPVRIAHSGVSSGPGVVRIAMTVSNLARAVHFYTQILPFEVVQNNIDRRGEDVDRLFSIEHVSARVARLRLGKEEIELVEYPGSRARPYAPNFRSNDQVFQHIAIIVSDIDRAFAILKANKVRAVSKMGPQRLPDWNKNAGGIRAFYFNDPDRHVVEILQFPPDKGDAKWHARRDLWLGIDHTAIVSTDTAASLRFYRDGLHLNVVGESLNYGVEQERLNAVTGVRLRITALRGNFGPGIELLEYLSPRDGVLFPADNRVTDLWHWHVYLVTPDLAAVVKRAAVARGYGANGTPPVITALRSTSTLPAASKAARVRDPDGHTLVLLQ